MPQTTKESRPVIDEVVTALLGKADEEKPELRANVERLARDYDARTVDAFCRTLAEHLDEHPGAVRPLEALIVLCLAHPKLLSKHRIQLVQEGRRLAVLLEKQGELPRAQSLLEALTSKNPDDRGLCRDLASMMERTGNADRLVERYLRRAETALAERRRDDAVVWLHEVLSIDRSRRDVARMIRDLQYEDVDKRRRLRGVLRSIAGAGLIAALVTGAVWRETDIDGRYLAIPSAAPSDLDGLRKRLAAIDQLVASSPLWLGIFEASHERSELRSAIARIERERADAALAAQIEDTQRLDQTESARVRGMAAMERRDFAAAVEHFRVALQFAPPDWPLRARVESDIAAVQEFLGKQAGSGEKQP